jgi:Flp pilus assembly protein TadD
MNNSMLDSNNEQEFGETLRRAAEGELSLQQFLDLTDEDVDLVAALANALYEEERYDDALVLLEGLIALNDTEARYFNAAGAIFIQQERYEEALAALNKALELEPTNIDALVNRGEVFLVNSQLIEAAADFEKAIEQDPMEQNLSANRARQLVWGMHEVLKYCEREGYLDPDFEIIPDEPETPAN